MISTRIPEKFPTTASTIPTMHLFYLGDRADSTPNAGSKGSIEIVDVKSGSFVASIDVEGKNPSGLALDPSSRKLYIVVGDTSQVVVIDREKRAVLASWPITGGPEPHAVALDASNRRLFGLRSVAVSTISSQLLLLLLEMNC